MRTREIYVYLLFTVKILQDKEYLSKETHVYNWISTQKNDTLYQNNVFKVMKYFFVRVEKNKSLWII